MPTYELVANTPVIGKYLVFTGNCWLPILICWHQFSSTFNNVQIAKMKILHIPVLQLMQKQVQSFLSNN